MKRKKGWFITFEGTDGVGKSTQVQLLKDWLEGHEHRALVTREPGGSPLSEAIRRILLNPNTKISDRAELFLYEAARAEHVAQVIRPALKRGDVVLCDRFTDATVAYQGFARHLPLAEIDALNQLATQNLVPDLTLLLDLPPRVGLRKARALKTLKSGGDRLENEGLQFQQKVRRGYLAALKAHPRRIKRIPVQDDIEQTQRMIRLTVEKFLNL